MPPSGTLTDTTDSTAVQNALQDLENLEKDFAAVEIDASMSSQRLNPSYWPRYKGVLTK